MDLGSKLWWLVALTAVAGCGESGMESPPPANVLTRTQPASTTDCPFGGTVVSSGLDGNGNKTLDDAEVEARTVVCNDAPVQPAPTILVRLVPEPPTGGHCTEGGTAVQSGPDRNGNGNLDDDEVAHTDYVCGLPVVTRLAAEPQGNRCAAGGVVFLAGPDRDGDGVLDDSEVESTEISCGDRIERDVEIRTATDPFALKDVRVITGRVTVLRGAFSLPKLTQIGGALQIVDGSGATISFPALQSVGGELALRNSDVTALNCPQLRHIGSLTLFDSALHDLSGFPVLAEIAGDVEIGGSKLISATLPPVKIAGDFHMSGNPDLASADWTVQDRLGKVDVRGNARLATFNLSVVPATQPRSVVGDVILNSMSDLRLSANEVSSIELDGSRLHHVAFDFGVLSKDLAIFAATSPFDLTLSDPAHNGRLTIDGTLRIQGPLEALHTTEVVTVLGLLHLSGTRLQALAPVGSLRALGALELVNNALLTVVAPMDVQGSLAVTNNALLPTLAFPRFPFPGEALGNVVVTGNPVLTSATALATLAHVHGDLVLQANPLLPNPLGAPLTQVDGGLQIAGTASTELSLPNFAQAGTFVDVSGNPSMTTISLPVLATVSHELTIFSNDQLISLDLAALTHAGTFTVRDNPHLPACQVLALFGHVDGEQSQSGNDDDATCAR